MRTSAHSAEWKNENSRCTASSFLRPRWFVYVNRGMSWSDTSLDQHHKLPISYKLNDGSFERVDVSHNLSEMWGGYHLRILLWRKPLLFKCFWRIRIDVDIGHMHIKMIVFAQTMRLYVALGSMTSSGWHTAWCTSKTSSGAARIGAGFSWFSAVGRISISSVWHFRCGSRDARSV